MYISRRPVMHFLGATLLAVAAAAITATGPLMVLHTSFDVSPRMLLQLDTPAEMSAGATALAAIDTEDR
jgi:hypothetical protein